MKSLFLSITSSVCRFCVAVRGFRSLLFALFVLCSLVSASDARATIILDVADANGIGDNGGSPFLFAFSALGPGLIDGDLLEFLDYDALGIAITDSAGFVVVPLISFSPASSFSFSFLATNPLDFTAHVTGVGNGAFGLEIRQVMSVPEPSTIGLFFIGLIGVGMLALRRRGRPLA